MATMTEFSHRDTESTTSPSELLLVDRRCCFCIPYRWQKVRSSSPDHHHHNHHNHQSDKTLWSRGIDALKKIREWSEIVAGPRWKTFIRRFNRNNNRSFGGRQQSPKNFQYDPLGYSLNFDEGPLQSGDSEMENDYMIRNFSSRYASVPVGNKSTAIDVSGKETITGSNFV
ncbi:hypothetical protein OSB04_004829 [Centaurea solstitialis]|uniref:Uncharacterized protein n=1 Tax=Centaurea solstitialis TaxID=347529 RepID=A0AA38WR36_9ASTR|nr:hypothetical protein OSB04_004829 [Centaurea solstitialis]